MLSPAFALLFAFTFKNIVEKTIISFSMYMELSTRCLFH